MSRLGFGRGKAVPAQSLPPLPWQDPSADPSDTRPILPYTLDGLRTLLDLADAGLRFNTRAAANEYRMPGSTDWLPDTPDNRDDFTTALSQHARGRRTPSSVADDYALPGADARRRLYGFIARESKFQGAGSAVYSAVVEWHQALQDEGQPCQFRFTLGYILEDSGVLNRYESRARAPRPVYDDCKRALTDHGWRYTVAKPGDGKSARMLWISPFGSPERGIRLRAK